jgi:hypothetical protein
MLSTIPVFKTTITYFALVTTPCSSTGLLLLAGCSDCGPGNVAVYVRDASGASMKLTKR